MRKLFALTLLLLGAFVLLGAQGITLGKGATYGKGMTISPGTSGGGGFSPVYLTSGNCVSGGTSCTVTLSVTAGQFAVCNGGDSAASSPVTTCSDTNTDPFHYPTSNPFNGTTGSAGFGFATMGTTNASEVFTCNAANSGGYFGCVVAIYSGTPTSGWDVAIAGANVSTSPFAGGTTATTANANELAVGSCVLSNSDSYTWTGTNGWTFRNGITSSPYPIIAYFDLVLTSTGTQQVTATWGGPTDAGVCVTSTIK